MIMEDKEQNNGCVKHNRRQRDKQWEAHKIRRECENEAWSTEIKENVITKQMNHRNKEKVITEYEAQK